ncbi:DUF4124 domain-containing protein [Lysobacter capsici]|uniref:DUF4124 domain-containing protein n=1 Tax=Lysobacter capsici TaxID=435897 RepID=UPI00287BA7E8|nr:DUF4124 domain-containing protein [Lysobacter capsici]WND80092.1 DUF4124 domain-containing protein [Lysobacter capsici]WND85288.1 DUF4124 domain-containing protein [Lysobacter capsici]
MNAIHARRRSLVLATLLSTGASLGTAQAAEVLIYRCTDDRGQLSLRDTPCAKGQRQQTLSMARPVDPPPRTIEASAAPAPASRQSIDSRPRVLVVRNPQPMFDCVRPDGSRYTSSNGDGNPRMVPIVDLGYGVPVYNNNHTSLGGRIGAPRPRLGDPSAVLNSTSSRSMGIGSAGIAVAANGRHGSVSYASTAYSGGYYSGGYNYGSGVYYGSQLIRDECEQLPQEEVCSRLRDDRYQGDRRYNSALQSEREQITREQRIIDARMNADCGAY